MADKLQTAATLDGISLHKDGSLSLRFSTQEVSPEDVVTARKFHGHFGTLLFCESALQPKDIPQDDPEFEGKSPSKRLRAVIFVLWTVLKEEQKTSLKFEEFYGGQLENIINQYKDKLPKKEII